MQGVQNSFRYRGAQHLVAPGGLVLKSGTPVKQKLKEAETILMPRENSR